MSSALDALAPGERRLLERAPKPEAPEPMKALLTEERFSDEGWIFESKLDGVRCLASRDAGGARLISRTGRRLTAYPEIVEALERDACPDFLADGEIVAFDGEVTSFARLQGRMQIADPDAARRSGIPVFAYLFDLLHLEGHDTRALPLRARKELLRRALSFEGPVRYLPHRAREGEAAFREACGKGLEGVIAKRSDSRYVGARSGDWLKLKCRRGQELVIGGFTEPRGSRSDFGALLVGYYEDGALRYAGKVGTGFDRAALRRLGERLRGIERRESPFADAPAAGGARWVEPELVAQVGFSEWTRDGRLRHPRFLGIREDKPPREVVRERPR